MPALCPLTLWLWPGQLGLSSLVKGPLGPVSRGPILEALLDQGLLRCPKRDGERELLKLLAEGRDRRPHSF